MARPNNRRTSQRDPLETTSNPETMQPQQPITDGGAGANLGRFVDMLENVSPGMQRLAQQHDEERNQRERSVGQAMAVSEQFQGTEPEEIQRAAEEMNDPVRRDAFMSKRYKLYANEKAEQVQHQIEENRHRPDFDPEQTWQDAMGDVLERVPEEYQGEVADQLGIAHGSWRKQRREQAIKDDRSQAMDTYLSDLDNHFKQVDAADAVPNPDTMEAFIEDAREMNIPERKARGAYLDWAGRHATEKGDPQFLDGLAELRNDPELADTFDQHRERAEAEADKRVSVEETEIRNEYQQIVDQGEFAMRHVREIADDPKTRELYSEPQLVQMIAQSRANQAEETQMSELVTAWSDAPNDFHAQIAPDLDLSSSDMTEIVDHAYRDHMQRYEDQEEGFKRFAERLALGGTNAVSNMVKSQLESRATIAQLDEEGGPPGEFMQGYGQFRVLKESVRGGNEVLERHLTDSDARDRYEVFHELHQHAGYSPEQAYLKMKDITQDPEDLADFQTQEGAEELRQAVDSLDPEVYPAEAKGRVRSLAKHFGRMGMGVEMASKLAVERYEAQHGTLRGSKIKHLGDPSMVDDRMRDALDWEIEREGDRIRDALGTDDVDLDRVHIKQADDNPRVVRLEYDGTQLPIRKDLRDVRTRYDTHRSEQLLEQHRQRDQFQPGPSGAGSEGRRNRLRERQDRIRRIREDIIEPARERSEEQFQQEDEEASSTAWELEGIEVEADEPEETDTVGAGGRMVRRVIDWLDSLETAREREQEN